METIPFHSAIVYKLEWRFPLFRGGNQWVYPIFWSTNGDRHLTQSEPRRHEKMLARLLRKKSIHNSAESGDGRMKDMILLQLSRFWEGSLKVKPTHRGGQNWDLEMNWVHRTLRKPLGEDMPEAWVILETEDRWIDEPNKFLSLIKQVWVGFSIICTWEIPSIQTVKASQFSVLFGVQQKFFVWFTCALVNLLLRLYRWVASRETENSYSPLIRDPDARLNSGTLGSWHEHHTMTFLSLYADGFL